MKIRLSLQQLNQIMRKHIICSQNVSGLHPLHSTSYTRKSIFAGLYAEVLSRVYMPIELRKLIKVHYDADKNSIIISKNTDMGVMNCSRPGCDEIMCDIRVPTIGYICGTCSREFKEHLNLDDNRPVTYGDIKFKLKQFMATHKDDFKTDDDGVVDVDKFFDEHSR